MTQLSLNFYEVGKAVVNGHYEGEHFAHDTDRSFSVESSTKIRRLRAVIQSKGGQFSNRLRTRGYKYHIGKQAEAKADGEVAKTDAGPFISITEPVPPFYWSKPRAIPPLVIQNRRCFKAEIRRRG